MRLLWRGPASAAVTRIVLLATWGGTQYEWGSPIRAALASATAVGNQASRRGHPPAQPAAMVAA